MSKPRLGPEYWDFGEKKEDLIHKIHSYPAKFPAFITTKALQYAKAHGVKVKTIADVFCGCGTTAVEAKKNGKDFWGCDINPVATLIAQVKTRQYRDTTLAHYFVAVKNRFGAVRINAADHKKIGSRIRYWFVEKNVEDLLKLNKAISLEIPDHSPYHKFFLCAFSNILKPTSNWLTKSIKSQTDPQKSPSDVLETFTKQVDLMRKANSENVFPKHQKPVIRIDHRNFLAMRLRKPFADLIVTSPPYVTSYDYADIHQLSALWLGFVSDYRELRKDMIGNQYGVLPPSEAAIEKLSKTGRLTYNNLLEVERRKAISVVRYFIDIEETAKKCWHMLKSNGMAIFVIGNTQYKNAKIDNAAYLTECMKRSGFRDIEKIKRKISLKIMTPYRDSKAASPKIPQCERSIAKNLS